LNPMWYSIMLIILNEDTKFLLGNKGKRTSGGSNLISSTEVLGEVTCG
jgi:hypothetical protein